MIVRLKRPISLNDQVRNPFELARMGLQWALAGRGPLTAGAGQVGVFSQAEDGIRDLTVTGVQTCALPILLEDAAAGPVAVGAVELDEPLVWPLLFPVGGVDERGVALDADVQAISGGGRGRGCGLRSEGRRGGKERRARWSQCRLKKKNVVV